MSPQATTEFESTTGMSDACALGLRQLLLACADTKLLLGYHYGEWTFGTPELEAAVASCSLAQAELGHVRLLHAVLVKHCAEDPNELVDAREPQAFASVGFLDGPITDWAGFVAANSQRLVAFYPWTLPINAMRPETALLPIALYSVLGSILVAVAGGLHLARRDVP